MSPPPLLLLSLAYKASGGNPVAFQRSRSYSSSKVDFSEESKEMLRQSPAEGVHAKPNEQSLRKSFIVPNIVPRDIPNCKDSAKSGNETLTFSKTKPGMLLKPAHVRRASTGIFDVNNVDSGGFRDTNTKLDSTKDPNFQVKVESQNEVKESCEDKHPIKSVTEKFEKTLMPDRFSDQEKLKFFVLNHWEGQMPVITDYTSLSYSLNLLSLVYVST